MDLIEPPLVRQLGLRPFGESFEAMSRFTAERTPDTRDEIWLLQHPPIFTLGRAGQEAHLLAPGEIPVTRTDRGGQVTYHGPGQAILYTLIDLKRRNLGIKQWVTQLEQAVIELLASYQISARNRDDAPGVYVDGRKIASLGLRVRRGCTYHGLALNIDMDLEPFQRINPCGQVGLEVVDMARLLTSQPDFTRVGNALAQRLVAALDRHQQQPGRAGLPQDRLQSPAPPQKPHSAPAPAGLNQDPKEPT
jgi:lipoyl(octanoyl) transferase